MCLLSFQLKIKKTHKNNSILVWFNGRHGISQLKRSLIQGVRRQKAFIDSLQNVLIVSISFISSYHRFKYLKANIQIGTAFSEALFQWCHSLANKPALILDTESAHGYFRNKSLPGTSPSKIRTCAFFPQREGDPALRFCFGVTRPTALLAASTWAAFTVWFE